MERTEVQGRVGSTRNPFSIEANQLHQSFHEKFLWDFRDKHACARFIQAFPVALRAKDGDTPIFLAVGFLTFKNGLTVVECVQTQTLLQRSIGLDYAFTQGSILVFAHKNVVGETGAKA